MCIRKFDKELNLLFRRFSEKKKARSINIFFVI